MGLLLPSQDWVEWTAAAHRDVLPQQKAHLGVSQEIVVDPAQLGPWLCCGIKYARRPGAYPLPD